MTSFNCLRSAVQRGVGRTMHSSSQATRLLLQSKETVSRVHHPLLRRIASRTMSTMPQLQEEWVDDDHTSVLHVPTPSFRPCASQSPQFKFQKRKTRTSFTDFIDQIPKTIRNRQDELLENPHAYKSGSVKDPIMALFRTMKLDKHDWEPYAHFGPSRAYTRNLIATDDETFTLLLLCWNPASESKIHDHPCDGCWLQVLQGQVQECRYEIKAKNNGGGGDNHEHLNCIADETFHEGQVGFINDSIGLHKVMNPSDCVPAVTLHLYSPPFHECRVWVDDDDSTCVSKSSCSSHFSEYGKVL